MYRRTRITPLSDGPKAGIGVGVVIGVLLLVLGGAVIFVRRHKLKTRESAQKRNNCDRGVVEKYQLDCNQIHELPRSGEARAGAGDTNQELPAQHGISEAENSARCELA